MADDTTQRAAYEFFIDRMRDLETFTKDDVTAATGWDRKLPWLVHSS